MPPTTPPSAAPGSDGLESFESLTTRLRELFAWCGSPKYRTLSHHSGLAPSAISGLIGRRPQRLPTEATTLRFVEACLARGGYTEESLRAEVEGWRRAWRRLDDEQPAAAPPAASSTDQPPVEAPRRRAWLIGLALAALVVAVTATVGVVHLSSGRSSTSGQSSDDAACRRTSISPAHDVRTAVTWHTAFRCSDDVGAQVLLAPTPGSPVVSRMKYPKSWFVCWTRGKEQVGGNSIWYYTQGDVNLSHPEVHSWGFVAAEDVRTEHDPDPAAFRRCPSVPAP